MTYGVTVTGFNKKTIDVILNELETEAQNQFGVTLDLTATSPMKMLLESLALEISKIWDMAENVYNSGFVDFSTGTSLDRLGALLGAVRQPATQSTGVVRFSGSNGTTVGVGTKVSTDEGILFQTTVAGIIAGGYVDLAVESVGYGEVTNVAATLINNLVTPVVGVSSVNNAAGTTGGAEKETNAAFRVRIRTFLDSLGKGTLAAIIGAVRNVPGVTGVAGVEDLNNHTFGIYVAGTPVTADVDEAIEDTRPAGIRLVTDGNPDQWTAVSGVPINVKFDIDITDNAPTNWSTLLQNSVAAYLNNRNPNETVYISRVMDAIFDAEETDGVSGGWIVKVENLQLDKNGGGWVTTDITLNIDEQSQSGTITPTEI